MTAATVERTVRAMTKPERVAYLHALGWRRISASGVQSWRTEEAPA